MGEQSKKMNNKPKNGSSRDEDNMDNIQIGYIQHLLAMLAKLHISSFSSYEQIRMFLLNPYELVVSQMGALQMMRKGNGPGAGALREAIKEIVVWHRACTTKGEVCKHLKYFYNKIVQFEINAHKK